MKQLKYFSRDQVGVSLKISLSEELGLVNPAQDMKTLSTYLMVSVCLSMDMKLFSIWIILFITPIVVLSNKCNKTVKHTNSLKYVK